MELNLLPILNFEGRKMPIDVTLEMKNYPGDVFRFLSPVKLQGQVMNVGGCLELSAQGTAKISLTCDRCAENFEREIVFSVEERLKKEDPMVHEEDPEFVIFKGNGIELDELVYGSLFMSLPAKMLCKEDCKGLCPTCGKNLNLESCSCDTQTTDPRFDILDQLL
ncbi:YceD family protein [Ructibacterium gallinarum]|uniref:DUF177 domain-containing protein n=1 Tax=Ructibacterium gallinarum TaxID=2779355 RepID=A0A9D5M5H3_9FIRM|nr:DUF177 domain-containing protein [Ructibacterium gallinarum]MBE5041069.1 DUF177 domain-containing protein [Ructibacterium gallinarum]